MLPGLRSLAQIDKTRGAAMTRAELFTLTRKPGYKVASGLHQTKPIFPKPIYDGWSGYDPRTMQLPAKSPQPTKEAWSVGAPSETEMQQALIRWWSYACKDWFLDERLLIAHPLQGKRTKRTGSRMKAEGLRKGTLDLQLLVPSKKAPGLWIEMKTPIGTTTKEQKEFIELLRDQGYRVSICHSVQAAIDVIFEYLSPLHAP